MGNNNKDSNKMMMYAGIAAVVFLIVLVLYLMGFIMGSPKMYRKVKGASKDYSTSAPNNVPEKFKELCNDADDKKFIQGLDDYKGGVVGWMVKTVQGGFDVPPC
jgi:hypothetical protein